MPHTPDPCKCVQTVVQLDYRRLAQEHLDDGNCECLKRYVIQDHVIWRPSCLPPRALGAFCGLALASFRRSAGAAASKLIRLGLLLKDAQQSLVLCCSQSCPGDDMRQIWTER